jgi:hypothetical protein
MTVQAIQTKPFPDYLIPQGPEIPFDSVRSIFELANHNENTRFVCWTWYEWTCKVYKESKNEELNKTRLLITKQLSQIPDWEFKYNPRWLRIETFNRLSSIHLSCCDNVNSYVAARRSFLAIKGLMIALLKELPLSHRHHLHAALQHQLPDSMRDIFFDFLKLPFWISDKGIGLESLYAFIFSSHPSINNEINSLKFVKEQLLGPHTRGEAIRLAAKEGNLQLVEFFLSDVSTLTEGVSKEIIAEFLSKAIVEAAVSNDLQTVKFLLKVSKPIPDYFRGLAVLRAIKNTEIVKVLLADGPIHGHYCYLAVFNAIREDAIELVELLLAKGPLCKDNRHLLREIVAGENNPMLNQLLTTYFDKPLPQDNEVNFPDSFLKYARFHL